MKYLMQQPTSCTLKCFPDIVAFDKKEKFLPLIINDGEKNRPPTGKLASSFYTIFMTFIQIGRQCHSGLCLFRQNQLFVYSKNTKLLLIKIITENNGTRATLQIKIESLPAK